MRVLLTGSSGQVGGELLRALRGFGEVIAANRTQMDLTDLKQVRKFIRATRPTLIINPAAYVNVDGAESEEKHARRINAEAPAVIAEEAKRLGAAVVHYSTNYVFDGCRADDYTEEDAPNPLNVYGCTKQAGEEAICTSGVAHLILRINFIYGLHGKNFLLTVRRLAQERKELRIVADQFGSPTWAQTVAQATVCALKTLQIPSDTTCLARWQIHGGLYHLSARGTTSFYGFAKSIFDQCSKDKKPVIIPVATSEYPLPAQRPAHAVLSSEKFMRTFCTLPAWDDDLRMFFSAQQQHDCKSQV